MKFYQVTTNNTRKKKVIYILSLGHSGSTLLDYLLSLHTDFIGWGEISNIYTGKNNTEGTKYECSCGHSYGNCEIWSHVPNLNKAKGVLEFEVFYKQIVDSIGEKYSGIIDSSKKKKSLKKLLSLHADGHIDLRVVFLAKDARAWTASSKDLLGPSKNNFAPMWFGLFGGLVSGISGTRR